MRYVDIFEMDGTLTCGGCKYCHEHTNADGKPERYCLKIFTDNQRREMKQSDEVKDTERHLVNCPIKELPQKEPANDYNFETYVNGHAKGWNDCIDHLTGEGTVK